MKILNAQQIREVDKLTIDGEPIKSIDLMERAAKRCFEWIKRHGRDIRRVHVFCGMGNNGGDGLAIARMLGGTGKKVAVHIARHASEGSPDFLVNEKRLKGVKNLSGHWLEAGEELPVISRDDLVIDALFGSGLNRPLSGFPADIVQHINQSGALVVAIDIPSGMFCEDNTNNDPNCIVRADYTLTFQLPKLSFLFPDNEVFTGHWQVLDIGLSPEGIEASETPYYFLEAKELQGFYKQRKRFSHKGHFGHGLLIAGSRGKIGAALIAAKAALRSGAGLLSVCLPGTACETLHVHLPEAMCLPDENPGFITKIPDLREYNAIGVGPGLGTGDQTSRALKLLIQETRLPLILDADALNILSDNPTWRGFLAPGSILTPHPGEFERLAGPSGNGYERLMKAKEFAHRFQLILVLKGAYTAIITPEGKVFFNPTGNPGMATGGSGDALTGMILGWLAQGYSPLQSCLAAVYTHGLAGDLAAGGKGFEGLIAGDIVEMIPKAIKKSFFS